MTGTLDFTTPRTDLRHTANSGGRAPVARGDALRAAAIVVVSLALLTAPAAKAGSMERAVAPAAPPADAILIIKSEHRLYLMHDGLPVRSYTIALGLSPVGPKRQEHDFRTPEGHYVIDARRPNSRYFRALHVSYPNTDDRKQAAERHVSAGRDIMIHGLPNVMQKPSSYYRTQDWTNGCIALSNEDVLELWALVHDRIPVEIVP